MRSRPLFRNVALSVALPFIAIQWLLHEGYSPMFAMSVATVFPVIEMVIEFVRTRRVGVLAIVALVGIALGFGLTFVTGNPVFTLLKDSAFTGIFGLIFLASLAMPRPLIYRLNLDLVADDPAARAEAEALWEYPRARAIFRLLTLVWGLGLFCEASARVIVGLTLPLRTATSLSPLIQLIFLGGLVVWTVMYVKNRRRQAATASS